MNVRLPYIIITEGEMSALSLVINGYPAIAYKSGKNQPADQIFSKSSIVYIACESGEGGQAYAKNIVDNFVDKSKVRVIRLPDDTDTNDLMVAGDLDKFLGSSKYRITRMRGD